MAPKDKSYYILTDTDAHYPDSLPALGSGEGDLQVDFCIQMKILQ